MFSSSSFRGQQVNGDGTRNVYCYNCKEFICSTVQPITKALCVICDAAENGKSLTVEAVQAYEAQKMGHASVSMLLVNDDMPDGLGKKFTLRSMANEFVRTVVGSAGNLFRKPGAQVKEELTSVKTSKDKRRGRILQNIDLGSMNDIDAALKKGKENES